MNYEAVIGLETHAQLLTRSKMFCGCEVVFGAEPNTRTCPVCTGMPGVLPVINRRAIEMTVRTGLAAGCAIAPRSRFARKNYFYPDLPKGYQISQYEQPLCTGGSLEIVVDGSTRRVGIHRVHLEEDAGKSLHEGLGRFSHVDLNRAGVPLMEIVSEPDLRSAREAVVYLRALRDVLIYLEVCDGNMEEGNLRCDANVSVRPMGQEALGTKAEIKNLNSFRFLERAIEHEIERQVARLGRGERVVQETRLWDPRQGTTIAMRSKEEAHDYRYFPEPDLVPVEASREWIDRIAAGLPELPAARRERFVSQYGIPAYNAALLTSSPELAEYFEACVRLLPSPKAISNWIMTELLRERAPEGETELLSRVMPPERLIGLLRLTEDGTISGKITKDVFAEMLAAGPEGPSAEEIVRRKGLVQIRDEAEIGRHVDRVLADHPREVARYRAGETKLLGFFVGQVMRATGGKANPQVLQNALKRRLEG